MDMMAIGRTCPDKTAVLGGRTQLLRLQGESKKTHTASFDPLIPHRTNPVRGYKECDSFPMFYVVHCQGSTAT